MLTGRAIGCVRTNRISVIIARTVTQDEGTTRVRILLAEDDEMLADAIFRTLSQNAHRVDAVRDGQQADDALCAND